MLGPQDDLLHPEEPSTGENEQIADLSQIDSERDSLQQTRSLDGSRRERAAPGEVPTVLGRYVIKRKIGQGGFGDVYHGYDGQLDRDVAIKIANSKATEKDAEDFLSEARRVARLRHPAIVTVFDVGIDANNQCYIVADFLDGQTLHKWLETHQPDWRTTVNIIITLARAIAHAHAQSTIHRDIKPGNIMMLNAADPVLVDFGLALTDQDDTEGWLNTIVGTPAYMSPEQTEGRAHTIDGRTDIYSLAVVMYHMLCGRPPFRAKNPRALLRQIQEDRPQPPRQLVPAIPVQLEQICLRAMAKNPDERYMTAGDFADALQSLVDGAASFVSGSMTALSVSEFDTGEQSTSEIQRSPQSSIQRRKHGRAERRQVTLLHCTWEVLDAEDAAPADLDPDDLHELTTEFRDLCRVTFARLEGTTLASSGEELLVCFGYPIGYEDSARRAVSSALELVQSIRQFNDRVQNSHKARLTATTSVHTGLVVVSEPDDARSVESISVVGDARNIVTRLQHLVEPEVVVVTDSTYRLIRRHFECESRGTERVRGARKSIELFEVKRQLSEPAIAGDAVELTPLVGRDREVGLLEEKWEEAQEGIGQVILLTGDAGMGKSRLVQTIRDHVLEESGPSDSQPVIEWRCSAFHRSSGLFAAIEFFGRLLGFRHDEPPREKFNRLVEYLDEVPIGDRNEVVPLFAALLSLPLDDRFAPLNLTPARQKERMFETLVDWLRAIAAEQPVLFIVEDLHWIDPSTEEFLGLLASQVQSDQLLTLLTFRPDYEPPWSGSTHQTQVALNRLRKKQIAEMMMLKTGMRDLPEDVVEQIVDRTNGIPLFVEEFTQMVWEAGGLREVDGEVSITSEFSLDGIPATLQDLIVARLDRMDCDRRVVQLAATLGREFTWEVLAAIEPGNDPMLQAELKKLADADLINQRGRPPRAVYQFKHALIQDAAYDSMLKKDRQENHRRIGEVLEQHFPDTAESQPELLAHHFTRAGEADKGIPYWLKAGMRAQSQSAVVEAIDHFDHGLDLLASLNESTPRDQQELQFQLPLGNVLIQAKGYAAPEVEEAFVRAHALCEQIGEGSPLFHVSVGMWKYTLVNGDFEQCTKWADDLLRLADAQDDPGVVMEACFPTCCTLFYVGRYEESVKFGQRGVSMYDDQRCRFHAQFTGQNAGVGTPAYGSLAMWAWGYPDKALKWSREGVALGEGLNDPFSYAFGLYHLGWLEYWCGNWEEARQCGDTGRALAEELNFQFFEALAIINQGVSMVGACDGPSKELDAGIERTRQGLAAYVGTGAKLHISHPYIVMADGLLKAGRLDEAQVELDNAFAYSDRAGEVFAVPEMHRLQGEILLARSAKNHDAAEPCFRKAIEVARQQASKSWLLRAAGSLVRLDRASSEAQSILQEAYDAFDEGFDTADLIAARKLLHEVGASR